MSSELWRELELGVLIFCAKNRFFMSLNKLRWSLVKLLRIVLKNYLMSDKTNLLLLKILFYFRWYG